MRAIYIDDEPIMIRAFRRLSRGVCCMENVKYFDDSDKAIEYVKNNRVDIVFADILLPEINGIQLVKKIRRINPNIYIVFVSALDKSDVPDILECDDYLGKPYSKMQMDEIIRKYCKKKACC